MRKLFKNFIIILLIITSFSIFISTMIFTQESEQSDKNPLPEDSYTVSYYENLIRRTMSGSKSLNEDELTQYQTYYKFYRTDDYYKTTIMIERYEKLDKNEFQLIQRFMLDEMGNIVKEEAFGFDGSLTSFTIYKFDDMGRLVSSTKYDGEGNERSSSKTAYYSDGTVLMKEQYLRGKLVKKEIFGERNELKKVYLYFYYPNGKIEKKEQYDGNNTIQKVIGYDTDGMASLKVLYNKEGEVEEVIELRPTTNSEEDFEKLEELEDIKTGKVYGKGIGPNIIVVNEMFNFLHKNMNNNQDLYVRDKIFYNNGQDLLFAALYTQGIDLTKELKELSEKLIKGKLFYLWQIFKTRDWVIEGNFDDYKNNVKKGDLLFFDNVYDANGDGRYNDAKSHVGIVEKIEGYERTIIFIHSLEGSGIQRGKINMNSPTEVEFNTVFQRKGTRAIRTTTALSGIASPDYLQLKLERNE